MELKNHFEIAVMLKQKPYCRINSIEVFYREEADDFLMDIHSRFPEDEGFECSLEYVSVEVL